MNYGDWFNNAAAKRCADLGIRTAERQQVPLLSHNSRVAQKRVSARRATQKVARLNEGERPSTLDPLELRLKLHAKETRKPLVDAEDVRLFIGEIKARHGWTVDEDVAIEYLENEGDLYKALAVWSEESAGYRDETRIYY